MALLQPVPWTKLGSQGLEVSRLGLLQPVPRTKLGSQGLEVSRLGLLQPMPRTKLGSQGLEASRLGLGCMGMSSFYGPARPEPSKHLGNKGLLITWYLLPDSHGFMNLGCSIHESRQLRVLLLIFTWKIQFQPKGRIFHKKNLAQIYQISKRKILPIARNKSEVL
jgi:hypothetical protein